MDGCDQKRRSFFLAVGGLGMNQVLPPGSFEGQFAARQGYVLGALSISDFQNVVRHRSTEATGESGLVSAG